MSEAEESVKYLGLPNLIGRNKSGVLGFLKEKMKQRVLSWKEGWITQAGREVLIKGVAQAMPTYAMSLFLLPLEIIRDFERTLSRYWWGEKGNAKPGIHWMCWERMSRHKLEGGLSFRDFHSFNIALLGKQGWRLATRPERLSSKIYKARYFPNCHFFDAELGSSPSFIWRSIWEAKQVVKMGARWKVGDGSSIKILNNPWLADSTSPYITTELQWLSEATVSSLRSEDGQHWDVEVIEDLFNSRDQQCILNTPVGGSGETDELFWNEDMQGEYTVKSAYRLLQEQRNLTVDGGSRELWKKFWRIKAPPKVMNMVWRAINQCLPTRVNLIVKRVQVNEICPFCNGESETIIHVLVSCPFANQCWIRRGGFVPSAEDYTFDGWLRQMLDHTGKEGHGEILTMCWSIWQARNRLVWDNKRSEVNHVVFSTKQYLAEWRKAQSSSTMALYRDVIQGDGASSWVRPKKNSVKVTVDAALFSESSKYGVGLLARDDEGQVVQGKSEVFHGEVRSEFAEAVAIKEALSWIKSCGWREVVLESDCLAVVQAIRSKVILRSPFGRIIMECRRLLVELNIALFFITRSANMAAHCLARESLLCSGRMFDRRSVPIVLESCLIADLFE